MVAAVTAGTSWGRAKKLAIRRMYLLQGLSPKEIADKLDVTPQTIRSLVHREGWTKQKEEAQLRVSAKADQLATTGAQEFVESVAIQAQELTEDGFQWARSASDAKEFAFAANGTKAFVGLARVALGLEGSQAKSLRGPVLNVVFSAFPVAGDAQPQQIPQAQTVDVSAEEIRDENDLDFA